MKYIEQMGIKMKRILIARPNPRYPSRLQYIWVNYPEFMSIQDRNEALTRLYDTWIIVTPAKTITLKYQA